MFPHISLRDLPCHRTKEDIVSSSGFPEALVGSFSLAPAEILDSNISLLFVTMSLLIFRFHFFFFEVVVIDARSGHFVELLSRLVCQLTISFHTFFCMTSHIMRP